MNPRIDASEAINVLGINHPVRFESADLNPLAVFGLPRTEDATTVPPGNVIQLDWNAMAENYGRTDDINDPTRSPDVPENTVAHELIHVRQQQDIPGYPDVEAINRAYRNAVDPDAPSGNRYEDQAYRDAGRFARYVHIDYGEGQR